MPGGVSAGGGGGGSSTTTRTWLHQAVRLTVALGLKLQQWIFTWPLQAERSNTSNTKMFFFSLPKASFIMGSLDSSSSSKSSAASSRGENAYLPGKQRQSWILDSKQKQLLIRDQRHHKGCAENKTETEGGHTPLIVVCGSPKNHDNCQHHREEQMPKSVIDPDFLPVLESQLRHDKKGSKFLIKTIIHNRSEETPLRKFWHEHTVKHVVNLCCLIDQIMYPTEAERKPARTYKLTDSLVFHAQISCIHFICITYREQQRWGC